MSEAALFRLNSYMPRTRFEGILSSLCYTDREDAEYNDGFFHIREMEEEWAMNTDEEFNLPWINVLDKIMIEWFNKYETGFMCVGRKPRHFGNEKNIVCCGFTLLFGEHRQWKTKIALNNLVKRNMASWGKR